MTRTDRTPADNLYAALTPRPTDTAAHKTLQNRLMRNTKRLAAAEAERRAALDQRRELFLTGRGLTPAEPFARLAAIAGVTEAAVIQAIAPKPGTNGDST